MTRLCMFAANLAVAIAVTFAQSCGPFGLPDSDKPANQEKCEKLMQRRIENVRFNVEDGRSNMSRLFNGDTPDAACVNWTVGVINNAHDACLAAEACRAAGSGEMWIRFSPDVLNHDLIPNQTFLGGKLNFTTGYPNRKCIALRANRRDGYEWYNEDCSESLPTLIMNVTRKPFYNDDGSNFNFSSDLFGPVKCNITHGKTVDPILTESRFWEYAQNESRVCKLERDGNTYASLQQGGCDEGQLKFSDYMAECPDVEPDAKILTIEMKARPEKIKSYVPKMYQVYDQNKRRAFLTPYNNTLLSISIIRNGTLAGSKPANVTFYYDLKAKWTLARSASNVTFENGDDSHFATTHRVAQYTPRCVFVDNTSGRFGTYGCTCTMNGDTAKCNSNHTTVFAVLLVVDSVIVPHEVKVLSAVTQSISLCCLFVGFIILLRVRKKVRGERIAIQINLVSSLFFLNFWTLFGDVALHYSAFCRAVAVLSHFFLMSTALWMTNEAILLFIKTSRWAFVQAKRRQVVIASMAFGWGIAAAITTITAGVGFSTGNDTYMKRSVVDSAIEYDYCWLNADSGIRWAATAPVAVTLAINIAVAFKVASFVYRKRKGTKNFKPTEQNLKKFQIDTDYLNYLNASLKAFLLLTPSLGIPWIFMLAANSNNETTQLIFMYFNATLNGLQGVFVFVIYCIISKEVRKATLKSLSTLSNTWHSLTESVEKRRRKSSLPAADQISPNKSSTQPIMGKKTTPM